MRVTEDVHLVIHVDQRLITADQLTTHLLRSFPSEFSPVSQFGHMIPAHYFHLPGGVVQLVDLEVFDYLSWPQRPQYNLQRATRVTRMANRYPVMVFGVERILREKILSQHQRQGGQKEATDIRDLESLIPFAVPGKPEINFNHDPDLQDALANLLLYASNVA